MAKLQIYYSLLEPELEYNNFYFKAVVINGWELTFNFSIQH